MADTKFSQFANGGALRPSDIIVGLRAGINTQFSPPIGADRSLYIANNGSDVNGNGSQQFPFATYEHARVIAAASATALLPYTIIPMGIFNIAGNMTINPFVNIVGQSIYTSVFNVSGQVLLDPSWATDIAPVSLISNCAIDSSAGLNFIFTAGQSGVKLLFSGVDFSASSSFTAAGAGLTSSSELIVLDGCSSFSGNVPPFSFTNVTAVLIQSSYGGGVTAISTSSTAGALLIMQNAGGPAGDVLVQTTGIGTITAAITNDIELGTDITLDGTGITAILDVNGYNATPVFLNGASFDNVSLVSLADGLNANANFTPVNYTPVTSFLYKDDSVTANLAGIDAALAGGGGGSSPVNLVYFSTTGSDITGNGQLSKPFATYEAARAFASSQTPSVANQFLIIGTPGQYAGMTGMNLSPWIHAHLEDVYFQGSGNIQPNGFDWGNDNNETCCIIGPNFVADFSGGINLDLSGVTPRNDVIILSGMRYINMSSAVFKGRGTATFYVHDVIPMSVTQTGSEPPPIDFSFSDCYGGIASSVVNNLTVAITSDDFESATLPFSVKSNNIYGNFLAQGISSIKDIIMSVSANSIVGSIVADGSEITVNLDSASGSTVPIILNGAIVNLTSIGDCINANFPSPVNYSPIDQSVTGNLKGIDVALGISGTHPIIQQLWVNASSGNDLYNGNISAPFQTLDNAIFVASASASPTNMYLIHVIGDQASVNSEIAPWIIIDGHNSGTITYSGALITLAGWQSSTAWTALFKNCNLVAPGGLNVNFGLGSQNIIEFDNCDFTGVVAALITADPTNTNGNACVIRNQRLGGGAPFSSGVQVQDSELLSFGGILNNLNVVCTGALGANGSICQANNTILVGTLNITDAGTGALASLSLQGSPMPASPQLFGVNSNLQSDVSSYNIIPTFVSGATIAQVNVINLTDGLIQGSYIPINYTPIGSANYGPLTLTANLAGIDAALGSSTAATSAYGEMYFQGNATTTTIAAANTPVKINATYNSGELSNFTQSSGTLTYTDLIPRVVMITADLTATYNGTSQNTSFYIALNGSVIAKSRQSTYIGAITPAAQTNTVQAMVSLVTNDILEIWVENNDNSNDIIVQDLNFYTTTLSSAIGGSLTLAGEDYLSLSGNTLTANPVDLSTSNVTGLLPLNKVAEISTIINGMSINGSLGVNAGYSMLASHETRIGNIVTGSFKISFNSQATNGFLTITKSYGGAFTNNIQALGSGICVKSPTPGIGDAQVTAISSAGGFGVRSDFTVSTLSQDYILECSFTYEVI